MNRSKTGLFSYSQVFLAGAFVGTVAFIIAYGVKVLDPTHVGWLLSGGDLSQHYLGWEFFRRSSWHFPIGLMDGVIEPQLVSVMYTDSIPLFALFFKAISFMLPHPFQYMGLFGLVSFTLIGAFAALALKKLTDNSVVALVGSVFFLFAPHVLHRMFGHTALGGGQFMLLAAFCIWLFKDSLGQKKERVAWIVLGILSVLIHMYFFPMILGIMCASLLEDLIRRKKRFLQAVVDVVLFCLDGFVCALALGVLVGDVFHGAPYGYFNANLNSLFNPETFSKILPALDRFPGQYEGLSYLGFGMIVLTGFAVVLAIGRRKLLKEKLKGKSAFLISLAVITAVFFIYSLANSLTFGNHILISISLPWVIQKVLGAFGSTGRFLWPVVFIWYFSVIYVISQLLPRNLSVVAVALCVILQLYDLSGIIGSRKEIANQRSIMSPEESAEWKERLKGKKAIKVASADGTPPAMEDRLKLGIVALENNVALNDFYLARVRTTENLIEAYEESKTTRLQEDIIYVFVNQKDRYEVEKD